MYFQKNFPQLKTPCKGCGPHHLAHRAHLPIYVAMALLTLL